MGWSWATAPLQEGDRHPPDEREVGRVPQPVVRDPGGPDRSGQPVARPVRRPPVAERAKGLGLEPDELAFYDAIAPNHATLYEATFLRDLIHDVGQTPKANL